MQNVKVDVKMKILILSIVMLALSGCAAYGTQLPQVESVVVKQPTSYVTICDPASNICYTQPQ